MKNKLIAAGTWGSVAFHFIVCGLPLVLAIFGSQLSFAGSISPKLMWGMMIFSGGMLALSAALYFKGCGCEGKAR
ncbi:MAG: hypothetical protein LBL52_00005, partial [Rickettsiales bacterium]|nr:hypothetical protein [Rickettsiales bacterium]